MTTAGEALAAFRARCHLDAMPRRVLWLRVGPLRVPVPHPGRADAHDLHHIALDVDVDLAGEAAVGAFELRSGPPTFGIALLCIGAITLGFVVSPRTTLAAWHRARGCTNVYALDIDAARRWSVPELRQALGL